MEWPRCARRVESSSAKVSNPPYRAGIPRVPTIAKRTWGLSAARGTSPREGARRGAGSGAADWVVGEPTGDVVVLGLLAPHDLMALLHHSPPVLGQEPEGFKGSPLVQQASAYNRNVSRGDRQPVAP